MAGNGVKCWALFGTGTGAGAVSVQQDRRGRHGRPSDLRHWPGAAVRAHTAAMLRWIEGRSRYLWLSLAVGVLAAVAALPAFTDPWPSSGGGSVFVVVVVAALVRGAVALGQAFLQGWREPRHPTAR